ncbi:putative DM4/DM12 family-like protein 15 [Homarus americanus]|uniref:Putative DM4/DM12 family-like protein 15 n=1 Tax=Homarus americanus TaxID=6706 RepID=A0A8J5MQT0_HOMAM|nr:putative DM4/DM12 family-like protein 15 [Homarus americanus]
MNRVVKMLTVWCVCVWGTSLADMCDRRDKRTDRAWRGDVGELEVFPGGTVRDRLQLHHRVRRFLSFPTGSVLSVTPKLTIPFVSKFDGYITGSQLYAFPIDLRLPNSTLRLRSKDRDEETMSYASYGSSDHAGYVRRTGRALDDQRITGFAFLRQLMDNVGLDGRQCLLRAVCEVGEEPVADLGITGELINLFFRTFTTRKRRRKRRKKKRKEKEEEKEEEEKG